MTACRCTARISLLRRSSSGPVAFIQRGPAVRDQLAKSFSDSVVGFINYPSNSVSHRCLSKCCAKQSDSHRWDRFPFLVTRWIREFCRSFVRKINRNACNVLFPLTEIFSVWWCRFLEYVSFSNVRRSHIISQIGFLFNSLRQ